MAAPVLDVAVDGAVASAVVLVAAAIADCAKDAGAALSGPS